MRPLRGCTKDARGYGEAMRRALGIAVLAAVLASGGSVRAEETIAAQGSGAIAKRVRPIEIGVGTFAEVAGSTVCRLQSDVYGCASGPEFAGIILAPRWRASDLFSIGALGVLGGKLSTEGSRSSDGSHQDFGLRMWRLEAEARWHPFGNSNVDPWLGVDAGLAWFTDSVDTYAAGDHYTGSVSATQLGPAGGAALGVDFRTTSFLALGLELRAVTQWMGHQPPTLDPAQGLQAREFGTLTAVSFALNGTLLAGR